VVFVPNRRSIRYLYDMRHEYNVIPNRPSELPTIRIGRPVERTRNPTQRREVDYSFRCSDNSIFDINDIQYKHYKTINCPSSSTIPKMPKEYDYELLTKKIRKVKQILFKVENHEGTDNKQYRAYKRKLQEYEKKRKKTKKFKAQSLDDALNSVHSKVLKKDDDRSSVMTGDLSIASKENDKNEDEAVDYAELRKRYNNHKKILKDLEKEHGKKKASNRKDYSKYKKKGKKYLKQLKKTPEYQKEHEQKKKDEERKAAMSKAEKEQDDEEEEQRRLVEIARFNAKAELELQKAEALERIQKQKRQREEKERLEKELEQMQLHESNSRIGEELSAIDRELAARAAEFKASLEEQEQLGMIRLKREGDEDQKSAVSKGNAADDDSSFSSDSSSDGDDSDSDSLSS
jgi:hypothetical protein